jgi:hypothetical protein
MPATYEKIATTTLGSSSATITFSSIGSGYTDLRLVLTGTTNTAANPLIRFNNDTGSNYSRTMLTGDGTSATSSRNTSATSINGGQGGFDTTIPSFAEIDIFSYAGGTNKTCLIAWSGDLNGSGNVARIVGLWRDTTAINRVDLIVSGAVFNTGTTATIYGILKA